MFPSINHLSDFRRNPLVVLFNDAWFATRSSNQGNPPATRQQPAMRTSSCKKDEISKHFGPLCSLLWGFDSQDQCPVWDTWGHMLKVLGHVSIRKEYQFNTLQHGHCIPQTWPACHRNTVNSRLVDILDFSCLQQGFDGIPPPNTNTSQTKQPWFSMESVHFRVLAGGYLITWETH